ncbi:unnamed protein product [Spirodela intermedia]|uniref:Exostosin GT47 domain-containing protein n=1 Tax=Spirodela intermedia TaxID=51605 RepID=A0A7I8LGD8_SPIIN|nr:unnamed protein product [Spirodela intermedia]
MEILNYLARFRKLCQPGIRVPVVFLVLIVICFLSFQSSTLFSESDLLHDLRKMFSPSASNSGPSRSNNSAADNSSAPVPIPVPVVDNRSSPSPQPEKVENSTNSSLTSVGSPLDEGAEMRKKKGRSKSPPRSDKPASRNCSREREPRKKRKTTQHVTSIREMSEILLRNQRSSCSKVPQWSCPIDQQILEARRKILNAPIVEDDPELYPPVYRNFSTFKRSYELMEKMLKVYVYNEGKRPIFHEPILSGIYAAEGWFMKHMEGKNRFLVDDPAKAHLFYMPFSSTMLRMNRYDPKSPHKRNLVQFLRNYVTTIAAKYPSWNRTGGADHFSVSCHDWASMLTAKAMGDSIRALCNADLMGAFEIGKDVSITLTPVRNAKNPVQNVGGKPGEQRDLLAFFAGQMHGYVRPLLMQQWGKGDPDIKVFGPLRKGRRWDATTYVDSMRRTKYCLCPRGYEANSPRLAEAFFYECVPVIISDNFVPPFFDVLNWEAFSVVVPVKDIPRLKEILLSIPREKYLALQTGVRMVQRHFLWHSKPKRYDLFHTTLHSVWFNRVLQLRER